MVVAEIPVDDITDARTIELMERVYDVPAGLTANLSAVYIVERVPGFLTYTVSRPNRAPSGSLVIGQAESGSVVLQARDAGGEPILARPLHAALDGIALISSLEN